MPDYLVLRVVNHADSPYGKAITPLGRATSAGPGGALAQVLLNVPEPDRTGAFRIVDIAGITKATVAMEPKATVAPTPGLDPNEV